MKYQVFVESHPEKRFVASVIGMPSISVDGNTEMEAILNAKAALSLQLAKGKIVTVDIDESLDTSISSASSMRYAGILQADPTFDDWIKKLAEIRRVANETDEAI